MHGTTLQRYCIDKIKDTIFVLVLFFFGSSVRLVVFYIRREDSKKISDPTHWDTRSLYVAPQDEQKTVKR